MGFSHGLWSWALDPWLFARVNTLLVSQRSHSDMDTVLEMSSVKSWSWSTRMEDDDDGISLASELPSMLLGSLGRWTSCGGRR